MPTLRFLLFRLEFFKLPESQNDIISGHSGTRILPLPCEHTYISVMDFIVYSKEKFKQN
jgi:hypothetical protein